MSDLKFISPFDLSELSVEQVRDAVYAVAGFEINIENLLGYLISGGDNVFSERGYTYIWLCDTSDSHSDILIHFQSASQPGEYYFLGARKVTDLYGSHNFFRPFTALPIPIRPRICGDTESSSGALATCGLGVAGIMARLTAAQTRMRSLGLTSRKAVGALVPISTPDGRGITTRLRVVSPWAVWWDIEAGKLQGVQDGYMLLFSPSSGQERQVSIHDRRGRWQRSDEPVAPVSALASLTSSGARVERERAYLTLSRTFGV